MYGCVVFLQCHYHNYWYNALPSKGGDKEDDKELNISDGATAADARNQSMTEG